MHIKFSNPQLWHSIYNYVTYVWHWSPIPCTYIAQHLRDNEYTPLPHLPHGPLILCRYICVTPIYESNVHFHTRLVGWLWVFICAPQFRIGLAFSEKKNLFILKTKSWIRKQPWRFNHDSENFSPKWATMKALYKLTETWSCNLWLFGFCDMLQGCSCCRLWN